MAGEGDRVQQHHEFVEEWTMIYIYLNYQQHAHNGGTLRHEGEQSSRQNILRTQTNHHPLTLRIPVGGEEIQYTCTQDSAVEELRENARLFGAMGEDKGVWP